MITGMLIAKLGIVAGTTIVGANLFNKASGTVFGYLGKTIASYAGAATGMYIGMKTANNLHRMLENADKKYQEQVEDEEGEVTVNG